MVQTRRPSLFVACAYVRHLGIKGRFDQFFDFSLKISGTFPIWPMSNKRKASTSEDLNAADKEEWETCRSAPLEKRNRPCKEEDQPFQSPADNTGSDSDSSSQIYDDEELVLSEVHINPKNGDVRTMGKNRPTTTFELRAPPATIPEFTPCDITIEHEMGTPLRSVGLQVWSGALLLTDFILSNPEMFKDATVLEIGCGAGLVAIACAKFLCRKAYACDLDGMGILELCGANAEKNGVDKRLLLRELDLLDDECPLFCKTFTNRRVQGGPYSWTEENIKDFNASCTIIVAADIIYENSVTFAFIQRLYHLLRPTKIGIPRKLFLALEKRFQFTVDDEEVRAPAWDFLFETLEASNADRLERDSTEQKIVAEQVDLVPQWIVYERAKEVELWQFRLQDA